MKATILATAVFAISAISAQAATLDFKFSFTNAIANGSGTVIGIVRGLTDNATGAASSVEILSNTGGFGIGEYGTDPWLNVWTVAAGQITNYIFSSYGFLNLPPDVTDSSLKLNLAEGSGLSHRAESVTTTWNSGLTFTAYVPPAPVPLPAAGVLLVGALGGLAALRRRKTA